MRKQKLLKQKISFFLFIFYMVPKLLKHAGILIIDALICYKMHGTLDLKHVTN